MAMDVRLLQAFPIVNRVIILWTWTSLALRSQNQINALAPPGQANPIGEDLFNLGPKDKISFGNRPVVDDGQRIVPALLEGDSRQQQGRGLVLGCFHRFMRGFFRLPGVWRKFFIGNRHQ
ncbi:MAG: hypothetical protein GXY54_08650 [Deltaproteobacteria bacterium]|nr:hypothetical protein [Deltaproteobacteria bacterium]